MTPLLWSAKDPSSGRGAAAAGRGRSAERIFLLALILAAFAGRMHRLDGQSLWRDEVDAVYFALRHLPATLSMATEPGQNGVLYFLGLRLWFRLVGAGETALRFPSACFGVLAVPLLWQVGRLLIDARTPRCAAWLPFTSTPLLAALFLAVNPYQLWYSQEGKMYTLVTALALAATLAWLTGIDRGGWRPWLVYLASTSLAIYSHLLMIVLIPLHLCWYLLAWPQSRPHWRGYGLALAGLTLPYLPMLLWQWELLFTAEKKTGFTFTPLLKMVQTLLLDQSRGFAPAHDLLWLVPLFFLGLAGLLLGYWEIPHEPKGPLPLLGSLRRHLLIVAWLLLPVLAIYLLSLRQPIFTARYLIWIGPAAALLLALGLRLVWSNAGVLAKPLSAVLLVYVLAYGGYSGWQQQTLATKYDLRGAVTYLADRRSPDDLLILQIPHMEYAYRYYSGTKGPAAFEGSDGRLGWWTGGLWTNNGQPDELARAEVDGEMRRRVSGADEIWVLRSEVEMWDARHLMDAWLDAHALLIEEAGFPGAQVRHYRLRAETLR